jgi:uroporphyrinogen decarboxylase
LRNWFPNFCFCEFDLYRYNKENFVEFAYPCIERIATEIKARHPDVPLLGFARDAPYGLEYLQRAGYDVMTVDAVMPGDVARNELAAAGALQA